MKMISSDYGLTQREADALASALHLWRVLDGCAITSGRSLRRSLLERLRNDGLFTEKMVCMVDGDGFTIQPERWRTGYALTGLGVDIAEQLDAAESFQWLVRRGELGETEFVPLVSEARR